MNIVRMADYAPGVPMTDNADLAEWLEGEAQAIADGSREDVAQVHVITVNTAGTMEITCQATGPVDVFRQCGVLAAAMHQLMAECGQ